MGATPAVGSPGYTARLVINEILTEPVDSNDAFFEIFGLPGTDLSDLTYITIDGDDDSMAPDQQGIITNAVSLAGQTIPADGYFLVAEDADTLGQTPDLITPLGFQDAAGITHFLVRGFTGNVGDDVDLDDNGLIDEALLPFTEEIDGLALTGGAPVYGPNTFAGGFAARLPDTGSFSGDAIATPGQQNMPTPDTTPPSIILLAPADDSVGVEINRELGITFDEPVAKGTGTVTIFRASDESVFETINIASDQVQVTGAQVSIDPSSDLDQGTEFYVRLSNGAVEDLFGNAFGGINDNQTFNFRTAGSPIVISEIMFNPTSSEPDWEWVEIVNTSGIDIDLAGYVLDDDDGAPLGAATIAAGTLGAGRSAVLFNADAITAADFEAAWGAGINRVAVTNWPALDNLDGDTLALWDSVGAYSGDQTTRSNAVDVAVYGATSNNQPSIFLTDLTADGTDTGNWMLSTIGGMTPVNDSIASTGAAGNVGGEVGSPRPVPGAGLSLEFTELWFGQFGADVTADWFEIRNTGATPYSSAIDGPLFYRDPETPGPVGEILGIPTIAPGERVVVVVGTATERTGFFDVWDGLVDLGAVQIGTAAGPDLEHTPDSNFSGSPAGMIDLYLGNPGMGGTLLDNAEALGEATFGAAQRSTDLELGGVFSFVGNASGAVQTLATGGPSDFFNAPVPAIGSPGNAGPDSIGKIFNEDFGYVRRGSGPLFTVTDNSGAALFFADGTEGDYFGVLDPEDNGGDDFGNDARPTSVFTYTGFADDHFVAQDVDGGAPALDDPVFLTWTGIDINGLDAIEIMADLANEAGTPGPDADDFVRFEINVDGGGWVPLMAFEAPAGGADRFGLAQDTTLDGTGDGTALTDAAQTFSAIATVDGSSLDLRLSVRLDDASEDVGIDNIMLNGATAAFASIAPLDAVKAEGDSGTTPFTFEISRTGDLSSTASVDLAVTGGEIDNVDFGAPPPVPNQPIRYAPATVDFTIGQATATYTADVMGDMTPEPNETFIVEVLSSSGNLVFSDPTAEGTILADDVTLISEIQGNGAVSPLVGQQVFVEAVVTGDFESDGFGADGDLGGFFLLEEMSDSDGDDATSEGIFVAGGGTAVDFDLSVTQIVQVAGTVAEIDGQTQINASDISFTGATQNAISVENVVLSRMTPTDLEPLEGMPVQFLGDTVTDLDELGPFGAFRISGGGRLEQFTQTNAPDMTGFAAHLAANAGGSVIIDDGSFATDPDPVAIPAPNASGGGSLTTSAEGGSGRPCPSPRVCSANPLPMASPRARSTIGCIPRSRPRSTSRPIRAPLCRRSPMASAVSRMWISMASSRPSKARQPISAQPAPGRRI